MVATAIMCWTSAPTSQLVQGVGFARSSAETVSTSVRASASTRARLATGSIGASSREGTLGQPGLRLTAREGDQPILDRGIGRAGHLHAERPPLAARIRICTDQFVHPPKYHRRQR